ncbi:MAG TPA: FAD-binding protein, partial [Rhizomicrobium sp.]|nr:FAD-binding protein [Rhizomicrobium sp.]
MTSMSSQSDVVDFVRAARADKSPFEIVAGGTRRNVGKPLNNLPQLDVSGLSGILKYEPEELILTALPGTPLEEIEALLAARNQCLAFEPPYLGRGGTLGGAVSTGLSGPRRPKAGA